MALPVGVLELDLALVPKAVWGALVARALHQLALLVSGRVLKGVGAANG